jgi:hypothetical protein
MESSKLSVLRIFDGYYRRENWRATTKASLQNDQLAISIKNLNIIANFDRLILQLALIFEKELGRGHSLESAGTSI